MAWQEVTEFAQRRKSKGDVLYSYGAQYGARLIIGGPIAKQLGWAGGQRIALFVGDGEHVGKLRLTPNAAGAIAVARTTGAPIQLYIGKIKALTGSPVRSRTAVEFEVDGGSLNITLPGREVAQPQTQAQQQRPPQASASKPDGPGRTTVALMSNATPARPSGNGKVSVNHKFFNDPSPDKVAKVAMASGTRTGGR